MRTIIARCALAAASAVLGVGVTVLLIYTVHPYAGVVGLAVPVAAAWVIGRG